MVSLETPNNLFSIISGSFKDGVDLVQSDLEGQHASHVIVATSEEEHIFLSLSCGLEIVRDYARTFPALSTIYYNPDFDFRFTGTDAMRYMQVRTERLGWKKLVHHRESSIAVYPIALKNVHCGISTQ